MPDTDADQKQRRGLGFLFDRETVGLVVNFLILFVLLAMLWQFMKGLDIPIEVSGKNYRKSV